VTFCTICGRPCEYELEPAVGDEPAVLEDEIYRVAMRNGIYIEACFWCWLKWPDEHKVIPGRPHPDAVGLPDLVGLLRETA
jgi:hypothetical protein